MRVQRDPSGLRARPAPPRGRDKQTFYFHLFIWCMFSGTLVGSEPVQPHLTVETNGNSGDSSLQVPQLTDVIMKYGSSELPFQLCQINLRISEKTYIETFW